MRPPLPRTAKDVFQLSPGDRLIYGAVIKVARCTGMWRYPISASGDLETMHRKDKIYWLYKAQFPIAQPVRGAGLEQYFDRAADFRWSLPPGFEASSELQLSAVGDLMDHAFLPNSAGVLYANVSGSIFDADISIANLECVLAATTAEPFSISPYEGAPLRYQPGSFEAVKGFCERNYSFMSTACNHSLDAGEAGVLSTIQTLKAEGIAFNGMNETSDAADAATIVHRNGFTIGVLSHTFGLNAKKPPKEKPWLINRTNLNDCVGNIDFSHIEKQIQFAHSHGADATVALLHWGMEHEYYPRPEQLDVAHHLAEMGIDIVVGHHPHVVQPMECYRTKRDPQRVVPIFYSLGNLLTPFSHPAFRRSAVARIRLAKGTCRDGSVRTYVAHTNTVEVFQEIDESTETTWLTPLESSPARV